VGGCFRGRGRGRGYEDMGMGTAYEDPRRTVGTVLLVVEGGEAEAVEGFGDGVVFVVVLLP